MENWVIKNIKADFQNIVQQCGIHEVTARCLVNRGIKTPEEINDFLHPKLNRLHDPFLMKDMDKACNILMDKIKNGKKIRIIGDYDADGITATYILYRSLKLLYADIDYVIPDRMKDGYGINIKMVETAYKDGIDTILTCDNGIVALEQVQCAKEYGMTVIITDHHSLFETEHGEILLPQADAVINPKQPDCAYPFKGLCGAAIAYKLVCALNHVNLLESGNNQEKAKKLAEYDTELLTYAAIATVCDVMELTDENRIIVKQGLKLLENTRNKGLQALIDTCGIDKRKLSAFHLGFVIGPCLNASGRLDTAKKGLELLMSHTCEEAKNLSEEVRTLNDIRKNMTAENVEKAIKLIEESSLKDDKVLVVYLPDCHESIAGIIAGRIREKYYRPTIILTEAKDCIKGSGRSIEQYNMIKELSGCRHLLLKVGGHPMAAGLSLNSENVEPLRELLNSNANLTDEMLIPKVTIDIKLPIGLVTESVIKELELLEPFGKGNERPLFAEKDLKIKSVIMLGKNGTGMKLRVENQYGCEMDALYFGDVNAFFSYIGDMYGAEEAEKLKTGRGTNARLTITYYPKINEYNGYKSLQLMIHNYR